MTARRPHRGAPRVTAPRGQHALAAGRSKDAVHAHETRRLVSAMGGEYREKFGKRCFGCLHVSSHSTYTTRRHTSVGYIHTGCGWRSRRVAHLRALGTAIAFTTPADTATTRAYGPERPASLRETQGTDLMQQKPSISCCRGRRKRSSMPSGRSNTSRICRAPGSRRRSTRPCD